MTRRLFLLILVLASMVALSASINSMEPVVYGIQLGGKGTVAFRDSNGDFQAEDGVGLCFYIRYVSESGDLLGGR